MTMQPRNLPDADPAEEPAAELDAPDAAALLVLLALDVLLPQAAMSKVAAPAAATVAASVVRLICFPPSDQIADARA
ncbi:MAG TPA: hypothetical protein VHF26_18325 [Trebonia sp.]|nr:hypothetical protein [Trebonia sp.]